MLRTHSILPLAILLSLLVGCDNVGRAFDRNVDPDDPGTGTTTSAIQVVRNGGDAREGRAKVKAVFPKDGGWPGAVPIVVEFSESMNEDSILPTSATASDGKVVVRVKGTTQALPASYDFIAAGRVLVVRPVTALTNDQTPTYETVLLSGPRDADGVRMTVAGDGEVLAEFQVNQDPSFKDGRILTTFPRDNQRDATRETAYYAVFDRPPVLSSITTSNFVVRAQGGAAVAGDIDAPLELLGEDDPRVVRFVPTTRFDARQRYELVVDDSILFGTTDKLDFRGRTPFAVFDTVGPRAPTAVHVGNPSTGFDDKINRVNFASVVLHVTTPADAEVGDRVVARIYGGDRETTPTGDLVFVERTATVPTAGAQTVVVDFAGALGTLERPKIDDGEVDFAVQMQRGDQHSGFQRNAANAEPVLDVTLPQVTRVGPPGASSGTDLYCDQEKLALFGTASERLSAASLVVGGNAAVDLFASASDGRFVMRTSTLGRSSAPLAYSLTATDLAGNVVAAPITGNVVQRGVVTGVFAGTLTVDAYDHSTLAPIADASVLVDLDVPAVPAVGQLVGTTDANGRATFSSVGGSTRSVTIVRAGYHLVTFYATQAAHLSLPLRPLTNATATMSGTLVFQQAPNTVALVGNNTFDDPTVPWVKTATATSTTIPSVAIQPNRPQVITAFAGTFEPTAAPHYTLQGFQMLGPTLTTLLPPGAPAAPGGSSTQNLALATVASLTGTLTPSAEKDFALAAGFDAGNLVGGKPLVRAYASMEGFGGQVLAGVGHATASSATSYSWQATYGLPISTGLAPYVPTIWGAIEATDTSGRISKTRGLALNGVFFDQAPAPSIPVITAPTGPSSGSPAVTYADVLSPATLQAGGLAIQEIVARDAAGRQWFLYRMDSDAEGGTETVQFPDLATANIAGLQAGTWSVRADARVLLQLVNSATADDLVLAERLRMEVTFARSLAVDFQVQ